MSDQYEDLQQSYGRCLRDKQFIERFYQTFLASNPAIPPMFASTDFARRCQPVVEASHSGNGRGP